MSSQASVTLQDWAAEWAPKIWSLLHRASGARQALSDEFMEIILESRSTLARSLKAGEPMETNHVFIERWLKRYERIRWDLGRWAHYSQLQLFDRLLWSAVFSESWNRQDVLQSFHLTPAALSFRLFRIWTRLSGLAPDRLQATERMCVRHDLFFVDYHMGWTVSDPAGVLERLQLQDHQSQCGRCRTLAHELQETMKKFQELDSKVPAYPQDELKHAWQIPHPLRPRHWPWWVQVPVQVSLVVAAVMGVLSVPYVGELWPVISRWAKPEFTKDADQGPENFNTDPTLPETLAEGSPTVPSEVATLEQSVEKPLVTDPKVEIIVQAPPSSTPELVAKRPSPYVDFFPPFFDPAIPAPPLVAVAPEGPVIAKGPVATPQLPQLPAEDSEAKIPPASVRVPVVATQVETPEAESDMAGRPELVFFRWGAFASDLDQVTPKIVELLERYGAERAGELELGAQYRGGRYFHFSLPVGAFDSLANEIRGLQITEFTNTRAISTDRRTPPGKKRVVFLIRPNP